MVEETITLPAGPEWKIHVDQNRLRARTKGTSDKPVVTVQGPGGPYKGDNATWDGPSRIVSEEDQLSCGARVWVVTQAEVHITVHERDESGRILGAVQQLCQ